MANGFSSKHQSEGPVWAQWVVPSVSDLIFVAFLGVLCCTSLSAKLLGDAGIGWHIRTGQIILATHAVPRVDPFSSSLSGYPWYAWEWLYDIGVGLADEAAGLNGVVAITALCSAFTFAWFFSLLLRRGSNLLVALTLLLLAISAAMIHLLARPHVVSWLFTILWIVLLESAAHSEEISAKGGTPWRLWLLPPVMIVWVNVHGGFIVGLILLAIYWVSAVAQAVFERRSFRAEGFETALARLQNTRNVRNFSLTLIATVCATFANPYGWNLHIHIYRYLTDHYLMDHIVEFQSPDFHGTPQRCFIALVLLAFVSVTMRSHERRPLSFSDILIVVFAISSGLYASRNIPVAALLLAFVSCRPLSRSIEEFFEPKRNRSAPIVSAKENRAGFGERMRAVEISRRGHGWPALAAALVCWAALHGGELGSKQLMSARFDPKRFPAAAVDELQRHPLPNPIFAPDAWGGYLIYRLYPQSKVVLDDRHDFYGAEFLKGYLNTLQARPGWREFLQKYPAQCVLIPSDSALASALSESAEWKRTYKDDVASAFEPRFTSAHSAP